MISKYTSIPLVKFLQRSAGEEYDRGNYEGTKRVDFVWNYTTERIRMVEQWKRARSQKLGLEIKV